jgi:signal transduction histidine kinase
VFSNLLIDAAGVEREIVSSVFPVSLDGVTLGVSMFRDVTETRTAGRAAVALAQASAQVVEADTTAKILSGLARNTVEGTSAIASGISAVGHEGRVETGAYSQMDPVHGGTHAPGSRELVDVPLPEIVEALTGGAIRIADVAALPIVLTDPRETWRRYPCLARIPPWTEDPAWRGAAVFVPLAWQNQVFGLFSAYLPANISGPTEGELAFYTAVADQAAVAVMSARLAAQAREAATLFERTRLARDLHDSVSQALFSLTMQVRAAQRFLADAGVGDTAPVSHSIGSLAELSRGAMAEMRALIFELRPGAVVEEGLVGAIRKQAAALSAREDLPIAVESSGEPLHLDAVTVEQLYRIALESLLAVTRTSRPRRVAVTIRHDDTGLRMEIRADGSAVGLEVEPEPRPGSSTLRERAASIGAELLFESHADAGRTVIIFLPRAALMTTEGSDGA